VDNLAIFHSYGIFGFKVIIDNVWIAPNGEKALLDYRVSFLRRSGSAGNVQYHPYTTVEFKKVVCIRNVGDWKICHNEDNNFGLFDDILHAMAHPTDLRKRGMRQRVSSVIPDRITNGALEIMNKTDGYYPVAISERPALLRKGMVEFSYTDISGKFDEYYDNDGDSEDLAEDGEQKVNMYRLSYGLSDNLELRLGYIDSTLDIPYIIFVDDEPDDEFYMESETRAWELGCALGGGAGGLYGSLIYPDEASYEYGSLAMILGLELKTQAPKAMLFGNLEYLVTSKGEHPEEAGIIELLSGFPSEVDIEYDPSDVFEANLGGGLQLNKHILLAVDLNAAFYSGGTYEEDDTDIEFGEGHLIQYGLTGALSLSENIDLKISAWWPLAGETSPGKEEAYGLAMAAKNPVMLSVEIRGGGAGAK